MLRRRICTLIHSSSGCCGRSRVQYHSGHLRVVSRSDGAGNSRTCSRTVTRRNRTCALARPLRAGRGVATPQEPPAKASFLLPQVDVIQPGFTRHPVRSSVQSETCRVWFTWLHPVPWFRPVPATHRFPATFCNRTARQCTAADPTACRHPAALIEHDERGSTERDQYRQ